MRLKLPSGKQLKIVVQYKPEKKRHGVYMNTLITVFNELGLEIASGISSCSPKDQFNKLIGRKLALQHMLYGKRTISKEDRRALWEKLCGRLVNRQ